MESISPTIVIIGITGNLAAVKLLPALYGLAERGLLGDGTKIIGTSRNPLTNGDVLTKLDKPDGDKTLSWLDARLKTITADPGSEAGAQTVAAQLEGDTNIRLIYFSVPPETFESALRCLAEAGVNGERDYILVEKPFGSSGASAARLHGLTDQYYAESNVFRVDHYLAKPGVRSVTESGGLVLDPRRILSIDVRSDEAIDIEGRGGFYEQTGALRDVIQSHLLQVLAVCMSAYKAHTNGAHRDLKADALSALEVLGAYRAQYAGYRDEAGSGASTTETYAALELTSTDHAWRDVRITVRSGKALPAKESDITVTFDDRTTRVFDMNDNPAHILDDYEQVLYDAARGERSLFLSARDVDESWRIVDPTLDAWRGNDRGLEYYEKGTIPATTI